MKIKLFAVAALLSSALAMPAMAQGTVPSQNHVQKHATMHSNSARHGTMHHRSTRHGAMHHAVSRHRSSNNHAYYNSGDAHWDRHDSGFWPGDVAVGIVGGAIGTAGAIASAPFRAAYAYDNQYYGDNYNNEDYYNHGYYNGGFGPYGVGYNGGRLSPQYAAANGLACVPGTWVKGADGLNYPCQ